MILTPPVTHLLVDLDGTLLGNRGLPLSVDFIRHAMGMFRSYGGIRAATHLALAIQGEFRRPSQHRTLDLRALEHLAEKMNLPIEETRKVVREALFTFFPKLQKHFFPIAGAREFLEWARERYPMILATNPVWPREIVELRVRWAGLDPGIFQEITHARIMHACKPAPEYYEEILEHAKLKPEGCLLIGNEHKMDLPATQVGIRVFLVDPEAKKAPAPLKFPGAKALAWKGSYPELRKALER